MPQMVFVVEVETQTMLFQAMQRFYFVDRDEAEKFRRKGAMNGFRVVRMFGYPISDCARALRGVADERAEHARIAVGE